MLSTNLSLGGFRFEPQGEQIVLRTPEGAATTRLAGFLAGIRHLLKMQLDLEGQAEMDGGLVVRIEGDVVRLKLGGYVESFPVAQVERLFRQLAAEPA